MDGFYVMNGLIGSHVGENKVAFNLPVFTGILQS